VPWSAWMKGHTASVNRADNPSILHVWKCCLTPHCASIVPVGSGMAFQANYPIPVSIRGWAAGEERPRALVWVLVGWQEGGDR
jgi:hypothetical protein